MTGTRIARRTLLGAVGLPALAAPGPSAALPTVPLGRHRVTRLIVGSNPINGISYGTKHLSQLMIRYFTVERVADLLLSCERNGINTFQSSYYPKVRDGLRLARERGCTLQFILISGEHQLGIMKDLLALEPIGIAYHGGFTDKLFREGKRDRVRDYLKRVHDLGLLAGISSHRPENLAHAEDSGWGADFYMACFYNLTRTPEEVRAIAGDPLLGRLFVASDPDRMTALIRRVKTPCLAFKILAAGRHCDSPETLERAFAYAYRNIKPSDAAIVGMYPDLSDEVRADADLARRYAAQV